MNLETVEIEKKRKAEAATTLLMEANNRFFTRECARDGIDRNSPASPELLNSLDKRGA